MDRKTANIVVGLGIGALAVGTDFVGAMMLAVPIEREYGVDITTTQWVFNVYALTFAMGLVTGGRLADTYGRRRLLRIGLVIFIVASLACALAPSVSLLIGARAIQGIGTAIIWPSILGLASTVVQEDERGFAIGLMIGAIGIGNAVGPIVAGVVGSLGMWRLFFAINMMLGIATIGATFKLVPRDADLIGQQRIDYAGIATLSLSLIALLYALDVGADWGWASARIIGLFAASLLLFAVFPFVERKAPDPLVPPAMMRNRRFSAALLTNALVVPAVFVFFLYVPQYLQKVRGWPMLDASLAIIPTAIATAVVSPITGRLFDRVGPRWLLVSGYGLVAVALIGLMLADRGGGYGALLPVVLAMGIGASITVSAAGPAAVAAADRSRASLAGGLSFMVHLATGAMGVAAATAILFGTAAASLRDGLAAIGVKLSAADQIALAGSARGTAEARRILDRFPSDVSDHITTLVQNGFTAGLNSALWFCLAFAAVGIAVSFFVGGSQRSEPGSATPG